MYVCIDRYTVYAEGGVDTVYLTDPIRGVGDFDGDGKGNPMAETTGARLPYGCTTAVRLMRRRCCFSVVSSLWLADKMAGRFK
ncbi:MAG: hypothetical protein HQK95_09160 [Nitrospirae bacterium]|nr:hypothetical protein [Nitrospirota bacterium]